jgi:ABC-type hemin transport system ATPase subunit
MLDFFRRLRREGRLVVLCLHPTEPFHLDILRETCERFVFVNRGRLMHAASWEEVLRQEAVRSYLGALTPA